MKIDSVATLGLMGIQKGLQDARHSAAQIASAEQMSSTNPVSMVDPLIALKQSEQQVAVSSKVVKAADDMIGTLLDVLA